MYNPTTSSSKSLVFVDSRVANANDSIENAAPRAEVIVLDTINNGVAQITEALTQHTNISSIHIVSYGQTGSLQLNSTQLNRQTLKTDYATSLASRTNAFTLILAGIQQQIRPLVSWLASSSLSRQFSSISSIATLSALRSSVISHQSSVISY